MRFPKVAVDLALLAFSLLAGVAVFSGSGIVRTVMAACLVFALPGVSLLSAWFSSRLVKAPDNILLTISLSLAITAIGGLVLNVLPLGLQLQSWALWLGGVTVINALVALLRDVRDIEQPLTISREATFRLPQIALIVLAVALVFGAIAIARTGDINQPRPGFTQLWMLPTDTANTLQLGVQNEEGKPMHYWLIVQQGGVPIQDGYDIQVGAGEKWEAALEVPSVSTAPVEADLYLAEAPDALYRSVTLSLSVANAE